MLEKNAPGTWLDGFPVGATTVGACCGNMITRLNATRVYLEERKVQWRIRFGKAVAKLAMASYLNLSDRHLFSFPAANLPTRVQGLSQTDNSLYLLLVLIQQHYEIPGRVSSCTHALNGC